MLVIEGSDNLGKTTLAKKIVRYVWDNDKYPCMYSWMTRPNQETFDFFESYRMMINPYTVQDRFHLGAVAYHKDKLSMEQVRIIDNWIYDVGGMIVILYANDEDWYRKLIRNDTRGNLLADVTLCRANSVFKDICLNHATNWPYYQVFDISNDFFVEDSVAEAIAKLWMNRRRQFIVRLLANVAV